MTTPKPTRAELLDAFNYDPETGHVTWKVIAGNRSRGPIGHLNPCKVLNINIPMNGRPTAMLVHRIAWIMTNGEIPRGYDVRHVSDNITDNRLSNLQLTRNVNRPGKYSTNKSSTGIRGIYPTSSGRKGFRTCHRDVNGTPVWKCFQRLEDAEAFLNASYDQIDSANSQLP